MKLETAKLLAKAMAETIKELKEAPAGVVYATFMQFGVTLSQYQWIEGMLVQAGLISKTGDLLLWVEQKVGAA